VHKLILSYEKLTQLLFLFFTPLVNAYEKASLNVSLVK